MSILCSSPRAGVRTNVASQDPVMAQPLWISRPVVGTGGGGSNGSRQERVPAPGIANSDAYKGQTLNERL